MLLQFSVGLQAQSPRTITLSVTDTIYLKPIRIVYVIEEGDQQKFMGMKIPVTDEEPTSTASLDDLLARLQKEKFTVSRSTAEGYEVNKITSTQKTLKVELKDEKELGRLVEILRTVEGVSGSIQNIDHEPITMYQQQFYTSLMNKGRAEAMILAEASGLKLGDIISISEVPNTMDGYMQMMGQMMKNPIFRSAWGGEDELNAKHVRTLMVQFSVQ